MYIMPRGNRLLLELDDSPHTFAAGQLQIAHVPDREGYYPYLPKRGTVLAIGPEVQEVKVGDRVFCHKYEGIDLPPRDWGGRKLMLIKEDFVICVIEGDPNMIYYGRSYTEGEKPRKR